MDFSCFDPHVERSVLQLQNLSLIGRIPKGPKAANENARPFQFRANTATGTTETPALAVPYRRRPQSAVLGLFGQKSGRARPGPGAHIAAAAGAIQAHLKREDERRRQLDDSKWAPGAEDIEMGDMNGKHDDRRAGDYSRKRRFREDDDSDMRGDHLRRGGNDRRAQRRRPNEDTASARVRKQIVGIADSAFRDPGEDVIAIASNIVEHNEDEYFRDHIAAIIVKLSTEQPFKIPFTAAIVLYTNQQKPEFAKLVLEKTRERIQDALDSGEWVMFKLLLRFLGSLQSLFEGEGVFPLLEELFNRAADLQTASSDDFLGIEIVKILMLTLPYVLASTATDVQEPAAELLNKTDIIASAPREVESIVNPYVGGIGQEVIQLQGSVALLQKQLQAEAQGGWKLQVLPRLYKPSEKSIKEENLINVDESPSTLTHVFPTITIPQPINPGSRILFPEVYFSLYADQDVETVPPTTNLAASLFRDTLVDTINRLDFNRTAAAKYLIDMDCYWAAGTFVKRATPFDQVKQAAAGKSTWKPEDLAVDAIFSQMLQLPAPEHKLIYYHSVITETCKIAPGSIAPSLGRAIRYLYKHLDIMDEELSYRFMDWFAHHLSNFDFRWKWIEWVEDIERTNLDPRKAFILGALDKEVRLSFAKRVRDTLPEPYHALIPASQDNDIPEFKYQNELTPYSAEAKQILALLKRKAPESDMQVVLDNFQKGEHENDALNPSIASTDAYVTTVCYIGSKSLSHVLSFIERCKERLISLGAASAGARMQIITSVVNYWRDVQPGVGVNIVDKLLNYTVLTPLSVVGWALSSERLNGGRFLAETWVFEMVDRTVNKVTGRLQSLMVGRLQAGLSPEQVEEIEGNIGAELQSMRAMFALIDDALAGIAEGSDDVMLESDTDDAVEVAMMRSWGLKWRRVFSRKLAVEETRVIETTKMFPPPTELDMSIDADGKNGAANGNGMGVGAAKGDGNGVDNIL